MNEYIILHSKEPDVGRVSILLSTQDIVRWIPNHTGSDIFFLDRISNQKRFITTIESPSEIESLIMGKPTEEKVQDTTPYRHVSITADEDPIDYLSDKVNSLIYELEKSEKENASLKDALSDTRNQLEMIVKFSKDQFHSLEHSNPANPCCRETFIKMDKFNQGMNRLLSQIELAEHSKLHQWYTDFLSKIQATKKDATSATMKFKPCTQSEKDYINQVIEEFEKKENKND